MVSAVALPSACGRELVALPFAGDLKGDVLGHRLTPTPLLITLVIAVGLALIGLWLWMARATSQGKNWARILSTVLFGLATLELLSAIEVIGKNGVAQAFFAALTWLSGLGAVWMLWRTASSAFFKPQALDRNHAGSTVAGNDDPSGLTAGGRLLPIRPDPARRARITYEAVILCSRDAI